MSQFIEKRLNIGQSGHLDKVNTSLRVKIMEHKAMFFIEVCLATLQPMDTLQPKLFLSLGVLIYLVYL